MTSEEHIWFWDNSQPFPFPNDVLAFGRLTQNPCGVLASGNYVACTAVSALTEGSDYSSVQSTSINKVLYGHFCFLYWLVRITIFKTPTVQITSALNFTSSLTWSSSETFVQCKGCTLQNTLLVPSRHMQYVWCLCWICRPVTSISWKWDREWLAKHLVFIDYSESSFFYLLVVCNVFHKRVVYFKFWLT